MLPSKDLNNCILIIKIESLLYENADLIIIGYLLSKKNFILQPMKSKKYKKIFLSNKSCLQRNMHFLLLFIIEYIYFHRFKRLNRLIYSSFSWFINRAYNHILVYYHNLIFAMISSAYGTKYIHGINYQRSISDS